MSVIEKMIAVWSKLKHCVPLVLAAVIVVAAQSQGYCQEEEEVDTATYIMTNASPADILDSVMRVFTAYYKQFLSAFIALGLIFGLARRMRRIV